MTKNFERVSFEKFIDRFGDLSNNKELYDNIVNKVVEFKNVFYPNCSVFWDNHAVSSAAKRDHQTIINMIHRDVTRVIAGDLSLSEIAVNCVVNKLENKIIESYYNEDNLELEFSDNEFDKPEKIAVREWYDENILPLFFHNSDGEELQEEYIENNYQIIW